ncbi:PLP-dependent transferase [Metschnikowia bicuspidata var. bicuspidata NRRL YB-4993]|uniref:PLP-dependent transferase n=1 Tax=Metschnikowia bicuspidata var. bicuspidata NRRL YB-4993 TaxID=869754 RepID=A0A1A0H882_9ASCO|nr:PLP-dependent transferase [Metschnikowia bicuspidata var. bicuspidata NRRL YB-4993]OBA20190.1 PLP-dependent transferase [Metschnikowia bicuspidata var. bicuspidata NRRL YB-4993]
MKQVAATPRIIGRRLYASFTVAPKLALSDLNRSTIEAKYAVRGKIPIRADELSQEIAQNEKLAFNEIISANIGNPQQLDQAPLSWYRQTLSLLQYPGLIEQLKELDETTRNKLYPADVIERASTLLGSLGSVGAYSLSQGDRFVRKSVAEFISKRDGYPANPNDIFLTGGASAAVLYLIQVLSRGENLGFLIPIPQYPLYTASIALNNATPIGYYLDEANDWSTDPKQIRQLIAENKDKGIDVKSLVIINPGNPTGAILSESDISQLIDIAAEHGLVVIADEVYQENVFHGQFVSAKKVLAKLLEKDPETYKNVQLVSLHSTSKGVSGECGQRGGYMELVGFSKEVQDVIFKLASINLCPVVTGQALVELMINPPKEGTPSHGLYQKEVSSIHEALEERATRLHEAFSKMADVECNKPQGAMYLFPRLNFDKSLYAKLHEACKADGLSVDEFYCSDLLENTGICCVPGSGFGQVPGTYHLRTTFLPPGTNWIERWELFHKNFVAKYKN